MSFTESEEQDQSLDMSTVKNHLSEEFSFPEEFENPNKSIMDEFYKVLEIP